MIFTLYWVLHWKEKTRREAFAEFNLNTYTFVFESRLARAMKSSAL